MRRVVAMVLLTLLGAPGWSISDTPEEQAPVGGLEFIDEVRVTVVNVDVFVRDGKGRPVDDLGRDDFRLLQDGKEVEISNFAVLSKEMIRHMLAPMGENAQSTGAAPAALPPEIRPVYVVLYID
ncbi:MAG: hypothetical protein MUP13_14310, partial [Thermoanaerobaculales bacterium]|nr:hypothetical protein [Thermoanaerobaculales bacterium]